MARFTLLTVTFSGLIGGLLWIIRQNAQGPDFDTLLTLIFAAALFVVGVSVWLFLLAHESQNAAWAESNVQTQRLMREIRAHERTDAELQEAKEKAEAANLAKSRYMMGLSHELRTPLNAIFGYAQILDNDPDARPKNSEALATIRRSAEHLSGLIEGLLDISKIEAGRLDIYRDRIDFPDFLSQISSIFHIEAEKKGLQFIHRSSGRIPHWIEADEKRLRQILMNLLSNAIRYTDEGKVCLTVTYRNEVAQFEIADTGCGIAKEQLKRIWNPFERGGHKSVRGTGLGLTITRLLVELLGGEVQVESEPGIGSKFTLRMMLPTERRVDETESKKTSRIVGYEGARRSIMVLDDETDHLRLIETLLKPLGFKVCLASSIDVAEELLTLVKPDLFLLDIDLPGKSGWEFEAALRRGEYRAAPIIMISAHALEGRAKGPEDALHDAFIAKPICLSSLLEQIRTLLNLTWIEENEGKVVQTTETADVLNGSRREVILSMARIGKVIGVRNYVEHLQTENPDLKTGMHRVNTFIAEYDMLGLIRYLEGTDEVV